MSKIITVFQIVISIILVTLILLQQRGSGLSGAFGGLGEFYATRRGFEKIIFVATIIAAALFIMSAVAIFLVS